MTPGRSVPADRQDRRITCRPAVTALLLLVAGLCLSSCQSPRPRFEPESIHRLNRSPAVYIGRPVILHGVAASPIIGSSSEGTTIGEYSLQDESGLTVKVLTRRLPSAGAAYRVEGFVGQAPENALLPLVLESRRSQPRRELLMIIGLLAFVLGSVPLALALLTRRSPAMPAVPPGSGSRSGALSPVRPGVAYTLDLVVVAGPDTGKRYTFREDRILVGRPGLRRNDLSLDDQTVSRTQAVIMRDDKIGGYKIRNEGRTNPLKVNGRPCDAVALRDGDLLTLGLTTLQVGYREPGTGGGSCLVLVVLFWLLAHCSGLPAMAGADGLVKLEALDVREMPLVTCRFRVIDDGGAERPGLGPADFRLLMDGRTLDNVSIGFTAASARTLPRLVLVVQATREERGRGLFLLKSAVAGFLECWPESGPVALVSHGAGSQLEQGFTTDRRLLLERLESVRLGLAEDRGYYEALGRAAMLLDTGGPGHGAVVYLCRPGAFTRRDMQLDAPRGLRAHPGIPVYPVLHPERDGDRVSAYLRQLALKLTEGFTGHYTLRYTSPGGEDNRVHSLRIDRMSPEPAGRGATCRYLAVSGTGLETGALLATEDRRSLLDRLAGILLGLLGGGLAHRWIVGHWWPAVRPGTDRRAGHWLRAHFLIAGAICGIVLSLLIGRVM